MDRRVRKTLKAISEALETLLQDNPIEQITTKQLAAEADIGYTTFFRHFPSKDAALAAMAESEAEDLIEQCLPMLRSTDSLTSTTELCRHVAGRRRLWSALLSGGAAPLLREGLLRQTLARSGDWPTQPSWLPGDTGIALVIGLVVEVLGWWLAKMPELSPEQVAGIMDRLFIAALVHSPR